MAGNSQNNHQQDNHISPLDPMLDAELPKEIPPISELPLVDGWIEVDSAELLDTQIFILERMKILTEPFGCQAAAALRFRKKDFSQRRVGALLTSGNADLSKLSVSLKSKPAIREPEKPKATYPVKCHTCRELFEAIDSPWCNCLTSERTLVCPHCQNCFCRSPQTYKDEFWTSAPQAMWDRKMIEHEEEFELKWNPLPFEVQRPMVLVVDDSPELLRMAMHMITSLGYGTIHASNGEEGLDMAQKYLPNLIITDALLPRIDGREMCRRLKDNQLTAGIKVIVTTALYTQSKYRFEALRTFRVDEYLNKPLSFKELQSLLRNYLG